MIIRTELITTREQWERLEHFASTFDHNVNKNLRYVVYKDEYDNWLAYLGLIPTTVGIPAIHPEYCNPRQTVKICQMMEGWGRTQHGDAFLAVPPDSPFMGHLLKGGFRKEGLELLYGD